MNMKKKVLGLFFLAVAPLVISSCSGDTPTSSETSGSSSATNPFESVRITLNPCNGDEEYIKNNIISSKTYSMVDLPTTPTPPEGHKFIGWSTKYNKNTRMGDKAYKVAENRFAVKGANQVLYAIYVRSGIDEAVSQAELAKWVEMSQPNHLYYHYYRFDNSLDGTAYDDWDVWAWPYAPTAGEGTKFDWVGRTQVTPLEQEATGHAKTANIDTDVKNDHGGAYIDIDLKATTYKGGWDADGRHITDIPVDFSTCTQIGLQIVKTGTRTNPEGKFWTNDGSNLYINLEDYAVDVNGGKAYHVFVVQDNVQSPSTAPTGEKDPFDGDIGKKTTYGNGAYDNANWSKKADLVKTAADFKEVGVGYQIMVSSFADSDGDGFGDIYGIVKKLDYLQDLGVKALWLTPIQLSDSYHGYDITDYEKVDPKFGSDQSPAALANKGKVDSDTAMEDYKLLIKEAHARGMKVVMDLVLNHSSTSNSWYVRSANLDDHYRGYYQWGNHTDTPAITEANNWYPYGSHDYSYYAKFGSSMPELNYSYVDTRYAVEEMSVFWARDIGVDGFRLDAVKHLFMTDEVSSTDGDTIVRDITRDKDDPSKIVKDYSSDLTKNLQFFRELKSVVTKCAHKDVFFVGENFDGTAYHVAPYYEAFDSLFDFYSYYNLTSSAATGLQNTTSAYGTASGFMTGSSLYSVTEDEGKPDKGVDNAGGDMDKADGSAWNFPAVYATYNRYRGDTSLPGLFTSNHDIARVVNRVAGTGNTDGIQKQKNITIESEYKTYEKAANLVKIAELMMPGVTWVYYGDEIGMTGNITNTPGYVDNVDDIPYADLWYRQPMKWVANGAKGDEAGTTDYYVTGSSMKVQQDDMNKSAAVKPALEQMEDTNVETSDYALMKKFIGLKTGGDAVGEALRVGSIEYTYFANGDNCANVMQFTRKFGSTTVTVAINFNSTTSFNNLVNGFGTNILASYGGATATNLPAMSAVVAVK